MAGVSDPCRVFQFKDDMNCLTTKDRIGHRQGANTRHIRWSTSVLLIVTRKLSVCVLHAGYAPKFSTNYDRIFSKTARADENITETPVGDESRASPVRDAVKLDVRDVLALKRILSLYGETPDVAAILNAAGWRK